MPRDGGRRWQIDFTPEAERWFKGLGDREAKQVMLALDALEQTGPLTHRPRADSIKASRHHNMKELRSVGQHLRALFAFDPRRRAVVLLGGDKTNDWTGWYKRNVPLADKLYDRHLRSLGRGRSWTTRYQGLRAGRQSGVSER
jgi:hypothetical protein